VRICRVVRIIFVVCSAVIATHCAMVDTIDGRYAQINRSSEKARNESILLNIVRASQHVPLNFVTISRVSGSTSATMGGGLPNFITGPFAIGTSGDKLAPSITRDATVNSTTLNASTNASNSFDLSLLESKDFYSALLSPVDLPTLNYFIRQGYPHELLYWLFADAVRETVGGRTTEFRNVPMEACDDGVGGPRCFRHLVDVAVANGLTVESKSIETISSGKGNSAERPVQGSNTGSLRIEVYARFCFDPVVADRVIKDYLHNEIPSGLRASKDYQPRCGTPWTVPATTTAKAGGVNDILTFQVNDPNYGLIRYEIITRSTFGIYQFLGQILNEEATERVRLHRNLHVRDTRLLAVEQQGMYAGSCFVELKYEGGYYCVPANGGENTKQTFSILAQLLALKTQTGDLAITPAVRITP
jgi:hypothetical protein